jgi:hypothetical protein
MDYYVVAAMPTISLNFELRFTPADPTGHTLPNKKFKEVTCGLRIVSLPTSNHLSPHRTTTDASSEPPVDGSGLPCPGSTAVADSDSDDQT